MKAVEKEKRKSTIRTKLPSATSLSSPSTTTTPTQKSNVGVYLMEGPVEGAVLSKLNEIAGTDLNTSQIFNRLRRRLTVRQIKRRSGMSVFDLDKFINAYVKAPFTPTITSRGSILGVGSSSATMHSTINATSDSPTPNCGAIRTSIFTKLQSRLTLSDTKDPTWGTPYIHSFASRLYGFKTPVLTASAPFISPFSGELVKPIIWIDYDIKPPWLTILEEIRNQRKSLGGEANEEGGDDFSGIHYVPFQQCHLMQCNDLLSILFWPGVDISEALQYPELTVVAVSKRLVVGCAFGSPSGYITYVGVHPGFTNSGIATFMLYHILHQFKNVDVGLHVRADNMAMLLYQKLGFKPEQFIVGFYEKFLRRDSSEVKNAFYLRGRR